MFADRRHLAAALLWLVGCDQPPPLSSPRLETVGSLPSASMLTPVFIDADPVHIHQVFLLNGLVAFEKAERWSKFYRQRWVRWSGQLTRINAEALCFRQFTGTSTYDVLLKTVRVPGQPKQQFQRGRFYNYIGRLDRYEDDFHTIYMDQGVIRDAGPDGVPGTLTTPAEQTRQLPGPPPIIPPTPPQ